MASLTTAAEENQLMYVSSALLAIAIMSHRNVKGSVLLLSLIHI